ncbi:MAG: hypothetical protein QM755_24330 [Luteolibacter sp.]
MRKFIRRVIETGAVFWFAMAGLMLLGSGMAWSMHGVIIGGGKMGQRDDGGASLTIHQAAVFWLGIAVMTSVIGIRIFREIGSKR